MPDRRALSRVPSPRADTTRANELPEPERNPPVARVQSPPSQKANARMQKRYEPVTRLCLMTKTHKRRTSPCHKFNLPSRAEPDLTLLRRSASGLCIFVPGGICNCSRYSAACAVPSMVPYERATRTNPNFLAMPSVRGPPTIAPQPTQAVPGQIEQGRPPFPRFL